MWKARLLIGLLILILTAAAFLLWPRRPMPVQHEPEAPTVRTQPALRSSAGADAAVEHSPGFDAEAGKFFELASRDAPAPEIRAGFLALKKRVHELPPDGAAAELIRELRTGRDTTTGLAFRVGEHGTIADPTTYRVGLLDLLGQTEPEAALAFSREILTTTASADEFAIALRNVAWLNVDGRFNAELTNTFSAMLDRPGWLTNPTAGFLEAFDVAVAVGGPAMAIELASVIGVSSEPAGSRITEAAAALALERLMIREPDAILSAIQQNAQWLDWAPEIRGSLLARLDVREGRQNAFLRDYLTRTTVPEAEMSRFVRTFPDLSFRGSHRLVTGPEKIERFRGIDGATIRQINEWLTDPTMAPAVARLEAIRDRLIRLNTPP
ncbi:MAG: hypothetical protein SFU53_00295 [Terrimicrobiaceae bacterium]|nr:hypothetical protein [Terrimicrobiaceae bacterium]